MPFAVEDFRKKFPQLERKMGKNALIYFDNGASTLKHSEVTDRVNSYNRFETANVHRGAHQVSRQGTEAYEKARIELQEFINAKESGEVIFTRGTTESVNLVASSLSDRIHEGDEIVISSLEHHSNIVPWQVLCEKKKAVLKVVPFNAGKGFLFDDFLKTITEKTKLVSMIFYSNSFGNRLPVEKVVEECGKRQILTLIDGAQVPLTEKIDVQKLNCDFFALSAHKMFGPYGVGLLYGKKHLLDEMPPYQTGGSMIDRVTFQKTTYAEGPQKFEAGTPNIAGAIGFGVAASIVSDMDLKKTHEYVSSLRNYLKQKITELEKCQVYDFAGDDHSGVLSFNLSGAHPSDVGTLLDKYGVAVRSGHHCTQPLMELMSIPGTVRISLAPYNTRDEINYFVETMKKVEDFF